MTVDIHPIIVGTAGHVDHGKSSLVRQLTGIDPDRWQEEKERGLTIDLGFAPIKLDDGTIIGLIDVPGHERFLKNMVAGATSIDLAILVIAADDGVMPQTREHLDVLELLGVKKGIVALTKIDIVDAETIELAEEEIKELLEGGSLEGAPVYPLSSVTGQGVEEFKAALLEMARALEPRSAEGLFRMPVQRVFSLRGFGTVLTGIPLAGSVSTGDQLELVGKGLVSRIRGMHAYGHKVDVARAGHSTAINLPDIPLERAQRGDLLAVPGTLEVATRFEIELRGVGEGQPLRHGEDVHLHVGTREVVAKVFLLDQQELPAGSHGLGQLLCREPVAALAGDFALLRRLSPARTIAGGRLIGVAGRRLRRFKGQVIDHLHEKERVLTAPVDRIALLVGDAGERGMTEEQLLGRLGWTKEELGPELANAIQSGRLHRDDRSSTLFGAQSIEREVERIEKMLAGWYRKHPMSRTCPVSRFRREGAETLLSVAFRVLATNGRIELLPGGLLRDLSRPDTLSDADQEQLEAMREWLEAAGTRSRSRDEVEQQFGASGLQLLERLLEERVAVAVGPTFVWGGQSYARAIQAVSEICGSVGGELDIPSLRDRLDTSRKYLIPFLEHLDVIGVTARKGNRRILRRAEAP